MTNVKILESLKTASISPNIVKEIVNGSEFKKRSNYYLHINSIKQEPLTDQELLELSTIVEIYQILYTAGVDTGIDDSAYDVLQELLTDMGIPRLTGSVEINDAKKVSHSYKQLRGTLSKIYYLNDSDHRTNKSRKTLDEWQRSMELKYEKNTGKKIDLSDVNVLIQPKFDGASCILECADGKMTWMTRGDTTSNRASDISHIMNAFNKQYTTNETLGVKFEVMVSEDGKDTINELLRGNSSYKNSRQVVTSTINSVIPDFKVDYLLPVPLRLVHPGDELESVHPKLCELFPTVTCKLSDRDVISNYAKSNKLVTYNGQRYRTDGAVITIMDPNISRSLGRDNDINNFEVAYKFTEEVAYSRVKDVEFYVSEFGIITPVLVINDVIMKGNTINHISLSNKERFDELQLCYGDMVKVLYDIIPYATLDDKCHRARNGRVISFTRTCPKCGEPLDLSDDITIVSCKNQECISIILGRIMNYCETVKIQNIGYSTLESLYDAGLLDDGIRSIYTLHKKRSEMNNIEGFGKLKIDKLLSEINSKRTLQAHQFMGAIGIKGISVKTFETIFDHVDAIEFIDMLVTPSCHDGVDHLLMSIPGISHAKATLITEPFRNKKYVKGFKKLLDVVNLKVSDKNSESKGLIVFTGIRPSETLIELIGDSGYKYSGSWSNKASMLVIPNEGYTSSKVDKAGSMGIPVIVYNELPDRIIE